MIKTHTFTLGASLLCLVSVAVPARADTDQVEARRRFNEQQAKKAARDAAKKAAGEADRAEREATDKQRRDADARREAQEADTARTQNQDRKRRDSANAAAEATAIAASPALRQFKLLHGSVENKFISGRGGPYGTANAQVMMWEADSVGTLTALGRLALLGECWSSSPVELAVCATELPRYDSQRARVELTGSGIPAELLPAWKEQLAVAEQGVAKLQALVTDLQADDPGYRQLFALTAKHAAATSKTLTDLAPLVALVAELEHKRATAGGKKSAFAGCEEQVLPHWQTAVRAVKKMPAWENSGEDIVKAITAAPQGALAALAYGRCLEGLDRGAQVRSALAKATDRSMVRGPLTGALAAIRRDPAQIKFDKRGLDRELASSLQSRGYGSPLDCTQCTNTSSTEGRVASVKNGTITFMKETNTGTDCANQKQSKRVSRVNGDGSVEYAQDCTSRKAWREDATPKPVAIDPLYAPAAKKGLHVFIADGVPYLIRRGEAQVGVFGVLYK